MKKGKWFALKSINGLLGSLLAVMGFSACEEQALMYGAVHADYTIKGTVTNEADEPLPGIRIRSPWTVNYNDTTYTVREDTVYTDANGEFTYQTDCFQRGEYDIPLLIEDIDGEANGGSHARIENPLFGNESHWSCGGGYGRTRLSCTNYGRSFGNARCVAMRLAAIAGATAGFRRHRQTCRWQISCGSSIASRRTSTRTA